MSHEPLTRLSAAVALAAFAGLPSAGALRAQASQPPHAFMSVFNGSGAPVSDLEASQVSIVFDGAPCAPVRLEPIDWPMKLTVLIDNGAASSEAMPTALSTTPGPAGADTSSVFANTLPMLREGLRRFLFEVPDGVETSLVTLAPQPRWIVRPTAERQDFWKGIDLIVQDRGSSKFVEGLAEAADRIDKDKGNYFFTIVVISTNGPDSSGGDLQRMFNRLRSQIARRPVTVHMLMLSIAEQTTTATAAGAPVDNSVNSRAGLALKTTGALQSQIGLALTKDTGGRYENIAAASHLLAQLPEYGRQIARSNFLQSHQYRVSCEPSAARTSQMSVFTSYPGARSVAITRDGRMP